MYRDILVDLTEWKNHPRRKPLVLTGVRQCGKTYVVGAFARENFDSYVVLNFEETAAASAIFDYDFDVHRIVSEYEALVSIKAWEISSGCCGQARNPSYNHQNDSTRSYFHSGGQGEVLPVPGYIPAGNRENHGSLN